MRTPALLRNYLSIVVLLASIALGVSACGDDEPTTRSLVLRVFNSNPANSEGFPPAIRDNIVEVRIRTYQNGRELTDRTQVYDYLEPSGRLPVMPFGENYQIVVEALGPQQAILADGATPIFDYFESTSLREIQVFVSPLNSIEYASALYVSGSQVVAAPSEFEGPFIAQSLGLGAEALGGQRAGHTVTELQDGRVVVIGGARMTDGAGIAGSPFAHLVDTIEVFDPRNGYWTLVRDLAAPQVEDTGGNLIDAPMRLSVPRAFHAATLTDDGRIVVTGGFYDAGGRVDASSAAEIIDPDKGTIQVLTEGAADLLDPRALHTAHWVDGRLWVIGGVTRDYAQPRYLTSIEVYDPDVGYFERALDGDAPEQALNLFVGRAMHTSIALVDGILVMGGRSTNGAQASMEFLELQDGNLRNYFDPVDEHELPQLSTPRFGHSALLLARDFENSTAEEPAVYIAVAGGYTVAETTGDLLTGTALAPSVEFLNELTFAVQNDLVTLGTARAHFAMVETTIARDLLILGGIGASGVTTSVERLRRTVDGGFPLTRESFAGLKRPRAFGNAVALGTHSMMIVGGWEGTSNTGICGQTAPTAGCTSELANVGDLFYLGFLY